MCRQLEPTPMKTILQYLKSRGGYARMKDMKTSGIHTREIQKAVDAGNVVKVKPGLYRLSNIDFGESNGLVEVCLADQKAIICLTSALAFHELTTFVPTAITYAIPRTYKPSKLPFPPTESYYFSQTQYKAGIEHRETKAGDIRIYCIEKTICDCFRFRNTIGEDIAIEGLKAYFRRNGWNINKLMKFAELCRVKGILSQYAKAIVG
jgi:predicted transcriptional regulator of viral defense system